MIEGHKLPYESLGHLFSALVFTTTALFYIIALSVPTSALAQKPSCKIDKFQACTQYKKGFIRVRCDMKPFVVDFKNKKAERCGLNCGSWDEKPDPFKDPKCERIWAEYGEQVQETIDRYVDQMIQACEDLLASRDCSVYNSNCKDSPAGAIVGDVNATPENACSAPSGKDSAGKGKLELPPVVCVKLCIPKGSS